MRGWATFSRVASGKGEGQLSHQLEAVGARGKGIFSLLSRSSHYRWERQYQLCPSCTLRMGFTHTPVYKVNSTVLPRGGPGPVFLSTAAGEGLGQVPHLIQVLRSKRRRASFPHHATAWHMRGAQPALPFPCPQSQLSHAPANRVSSIECFSLWGEKLVLPSAAASERWSQLCTALSFQSLVVSGAVDRHLQRLWLHQSHEPGNGPQQQPGPGNTMALSGNKATNISPLLTSFSSSDVPLSIGNEPFHLSLTQHTFAQHNSTRLPSPTKCRVLACFLLRAWGRGPQACRWVSLSRSACHGTGQDHASSSQGYYNRAQLSRLLVGAEMLLESSCGLDLETLGYIWFAIFNFKTKSCIWQWISWK